jgi:diketogulonate reductase-like aldo/keto reductase
MHSMASTLPEPPSLIYGTAWKEERTEELVTRALAAGFRAIDTANQRKHYVEAAVGDALRKSDLSRDALFVQTKFTYARGQDHRLPYDPAAPIAEQVQQSCLSSLAHLGLDCIDAYLLHGPWSAQGWSEQDREAWGAMEALVRAGRVRSIGLSNVSREQLAQGCRHATLKPAFVQNRCYARSGWDRALRDECRAQGVRYQGFSLLTANRSELSSPEVTRIAARVGASVPQLVFRFAQSIGMLALTGTSDPAHMAEDLAAGTLELRPDELHALEHIGVR